MLESIGKFLVTAITAYGTYKVDQRRQFAHRKQKAREGLGGGLSVGFGSWGQAAAEAHVWIRCRYHNRNESFGGRSGALATRAHRALAGRGRGSAKHAAPLPEPFRARNRDPRLRLFRRDARVYFLLSIRT